MAITYKSQGAGVSTETSGAALSPLCPATVDAGDILIAHVFWEGTATAPSTPSGWELLGSSPYVIETTIARHWVFGKIAAGTEDGSAIAFGSPAVTTQRAARIYSFAGRTGGTILELVTGFAHLSHATDPQMPTVTTTIAGALAVALVAQNDNNALADPTGESGGNWVRAVTEYTVALTPGFSIGICTATPTGDPGTISGGSMATTNDPCGTIAFQIKPSNPQNITAGLGDATFTGFAPTVSTPRNVLAALGVALFTGFAPVVTTPIIINAGIGSALFTGFAPTVAVGAAVNISAGLGVATFNGFAPVVSTPINVNAGLGQATFTGFAPTVSTPRNVNAGLGQALFAGFAPTIQTPRNVNAGLGQAIYSGFAPVVSTPRNVSAGLGQCIFTGFAPSVSAGLGINAETGQAIFTGFAPIVSSPRNVNAGLGQALFTGFDPIVATPENVNAGVGSLLFTGYEPTVTIGETEGVEVFAGVGVAIWQGFAPKVFVPSLRKQVIGGGDTIIDVEVDLAISTKRLLIGTTKTKV